ncbi:unnamed protein product [Protopolystoma xenopodis]|uniref:Uncharacterized protein n=1 Tax=Protopolystoma xenopodis TaxID=117903 RepID=A0A3S5AZZ1_9PLAT|nr:unnamed protein product [Protopolystoma xenopodis]
MAILTDDADYDVDDTSLNVPCPRSYSGNDDANDGLRTSCDCANDSPLTDAAGTMSGNVPSQRSDAGYHHKSSRTEETVLGCFCSTTSFCLSGQVVKSSDKLFPTHPFSDPFYYSQLCVLPSGLTQPQPIPEQQYSLPFTHIRLPYPSLRPASPALSLDTLATCTATFVPVCRAFTPASSPLDDHIEAILPKYPWLNSTCPTSSHILAASPQPPISSRPCQLPVSLGLSPNSPKSLVTSSTWQTPSVSWSDAAPDLASHDEVMQQLELRRRRIFADNLMLPGLATPWQGPVGPTVSSVHLDDVVCRQKQLKVENDGEKEARKEENMLVCHDEEDNKAPYEDLDAEYSQ